MKQLPPLPEPAVVRRSAHGCHGTFTAAQMTAYGELCIAPAKRTPGTAPMHSHDTTVGEGDMPVTCRFDFDTDGDIETMQVWAGAGSVNIFLALTLAQIEELDAECHASAAVDFSESKADAAISRYESDRDEVTL